VYVCSCRAVSGATVARLAEAGASAGEIARDTGAGTGCGTCRQVIAALLDVDAAEAAIAARGTLADSRGIGIQRSGQPMTEAIMTEQDGNVVAALNTLLTIELTVINQYFLHSKMCMHWGYERLARTFRALSLEEMRDAESYTDRILQLQGLPNFQRLGAFQVGESVTEQLTLARDAERGALTALRDGIVTCEQSGDLATAGLLRGAALEEKEHLAWAESQLRLVETLGEINYLTTQVIS